MRRLRQLLLAGLFLVSGTLSAWWDMPHMAIARIAEQQLNTDEQQTIQNILNCMHQQFPAYTSLPEASVWLDDVCRDGLSPLWKWHVKDLPYDPSHLLTAQQNNWIEAQLNHSTVVSAINSAIETLKNPNAGAWEKSFMLRTLLHCVGDAHQPLHCISLYNKQFPQGDRGGNLFAIAHMPPYDSLHKLWDACLGLANERRSLPLSLENRQILEQFVQMATAPNPLTSFPEAKNLDPEAWVREGYQLAIQYAYAGITPGTKPSSSYLEQGRQVALRQIAFAGYRLGKLLKTIFAKEAVHAANKSAALEADSHLSAAAD